MLANLNPIWTQQKIFEKIIPETALKYKFLSLLHACWAQVSALVWHLVLQKSSQIKAVEKPLFNSRLGIEQGLSWPLYSEAVIAFIILKEVFLTELVRVTHSKVFQTLNFSHEVQPESLPRPPPPTASTMHFLDYLQFSYVDHSLGWPLIKLFVLENAKVLLISPY